MKYLKPVVAVFLALCMMVVPLPVNAALGDASTQEMEIAPVVPLWLNVQDIALNLRFSGNTAHCSANIIGFVGTTRIIATFFLERQNNDNSFSVVNSWSERVYGRRLTFSASHSPVTTTGNTTYRLRVTALVTRNNVTEVVTASVTNRN